MAKIYIDIGHGGQDSTGTDTGTSGKYNGTTYTENVVNLNIGLEVKRVLESYGHTVITQRTENVNFGPLVGSYNRADSNLINSASNCKNTDCDCMISIHNNAYSNSAARGYVLIYKYGSEATEEQRKKSQELCCCIQDEISKSFPKNDVRAKLMSNGQDYYGILRLHNKIGVLIECGFMTNSDDMEILVNDYKTIGKEIADGVNKFVGGAVIDPNITPDIDLDKVRINILEGQVRSLTQQIKEKDIDIEALEEANKQLKERLDKVLEFDFDKNGITDEMDAVYFLKHLIDPEKFPMDTI